MERLTEFMNNEWGYIVKDKNKTLNLSQFQQLVVETLGKYENTGLIPNEVEQLQKENTELKARLENDKEYMTRADYLELIQIVENERDKYKAENAELKARLEKAIEPPCKVGDTVYSYCDVFHRVLNYFIEEINIMYHDENENTIQCVANCSTKAELLDSIDFEPQDIGKTVFLTKEEAEKVLKERR